MITRTVSASVLTLVVFAAGAAAQDTRSPAVLNSLEFRQLVTRGEPADHARLRAHFAALADRDAVDAKRHTAMSQAYVGNRSQALATSMRTHCARRVGPACEPLVTQ